jgi:hypothetical protein
MRRKAGAGSRYDPSAWLVHYSNGKIGDSFGRLGENGGSLGAQPLIWTKSLEKKSREFGYVESRTKDQW